MPKSARFKYKQVIVLRADLKMSPGKAAAQAAHASVTALEEARKRKPEWVEAWFEEGQKKVILRVESEGELLELKKKADAEDLPAAIIRDLGLTELPPNTITALGIGPAPSHIIDKVTGHLKLY